MGCSSSKILTRSGSYQEEINGKFPRRSTRIEELLTTSNGGDHLFFLLSAANTVSKRIKAAAPSEETKAKYESSNSKPVDTEAIDVIQDHSVKKADIDTINAWELLGGLDEFREFQENQQRKSQKRSAEDCKLTSNNDLAATTIDNEGSARTRSFHTVEDYDALLAAIEFADKNHPENSEISTQLVEDEQKVVDCAENDSQGDCGLTNNVAPKRMGMAKKLQPLEVPSSFEFTKSGSLKDWLLQGGQVISSSSYITPKFCSYGASSEKEKSSEAHVFDPEMVAQFEQALHQLISDEELALEQIIGSMQEDDSLAETHLQKNLLSTTET